MSHPWPFSAKRTEIDDSALGQPQSRCAMLRHEKRAAYVCGKDVFPLLLAYLLQRRRFKDAGVVDQQVDSPKSFLNLLHCPHHAVLAANIAAEHPVLHCEFVQFL